MLSRRIGRMTQALPSAFYAPQQPMPPNAAALSPGTYKSMDDADDAAGIYWVVGGAGAAFLGLLTWFAITNDREHGAIREEVSGLANRNEMDHQILRWQVRDAVVSATAAADYAEHVARANTGSPVAAQPVYAMPQVTSMQPMASMPPARSRSTAATMRSAGVEPVHALMQPMLSMPSVHASMQPMPSVHASMQPMPSAYASMQPMPSVHASMQPMPSVHASMQSMSSMQPMASMSPVQVPSLAPQTAYNSATGLQQMLPTYTQQSAVPAGPALPSHLESAITKRWEANRKSAPTLASA